MNKLVLRGICVLTLALFSIGTRAANVLYNGYVGLVEVRSGAWGSYLIISIVDKSGNRIAPLCGGASDPAALKLDIATDPTAKFVLATALAAKASGMPVSGWGIDPPAADTQWCAVGNFGVNDGYWGPK